jgi:DNA-binding HxlR family transcriptional regulator
MTVVKESSTIQENKKAVFNECPITYVIERIGGYWKPLILLQLLSGSKRYNEIRRGIPTITEKVLIQQLKQLEADNLVLREARPVVPPYVTYSLTTSGKGLQPVLYAMAVWAIEDSKTGDAPLDKDLRDFPLNI